MQQELTLEAAKQIADGAEIEANNRGLRIVIAIMDSHGNLKYYRRMDGNNVVSVKMAQLKANTSAGIPLSTKALAQRSLKDPVNPSLGVPGIVLLGGGVPIFNQESLHIGAIGISGANPELDGICAQAGIDACEVVKSSV